MTWIGREGWLALTISDRWAPVFGLTLAQMGVLCGGMVTDSTERELIEHIWEYADA